MTHTPGPWTIDRQRIGPPGEPVALLCDVNDSMTGTVIDWPRGNDSATAMSIDDAENEANARLIAAAPEAPHDCEVPDCPGQRNKRLLEATEGLLEACRLALKAQRLRTRKILHQIASEYSNEPPPTPEHTLPEEEEAHNKLTAAIAKAEEVTA